LFAAIKEWKDLEMAPKGLLMPAKKAAHVKPSRHASMTEAEFWQDAS